MNMSFLQYLGLAFVAAMVMSMQLGTVDPGSAAALRTSQLSGEVEAARAAAPARAADGAAGDRRERPLRQGSRPLERESLERGSIRIRVARGVVQA